MMYEISIGDLRYYIGALDETFDDLYCKWANDPEVTYFLFQGTYPVVKSDAIEIRHQHNCVIYGIYCDKVLIGTCGIYDINWINRAGEFRILIGEKTHWHKGIAKYCLTYVTAMAFDRFNLHKLCLGYNAAHEAAARAYAKSAFKVEYTIKEAHYKNGRYYDLVHMSLFKRDYQDQMSQSPH